MTGPASMRATIIFDRISRNHNVPPLTCEFWSTRDLAQRVWDYVRPRCMSRVIEVVIDGDSGTLYAGFHVAGNFTVTKEVPE